MIIVFRTGGRSTYEISAEAEILDAALKSEDWQAECVEIFDAASSVTHRWNGQGTTLPSSEGAVADRELARVAVLIGLANGWIPVARNDS